MKAGPALASPMFVPLMVEDPGHSKSAPGSTTSPEPRAAERIEIEAGGGVVIRLVYSRPAARIAGIASALREGRS